MKCVVAVGLLIASVTMAQVESSDAPRTGDVVLAPLFVSDYRAVWVNPANLGFIPHTITFSLGSPMEYGQYYQQRHWSLGIGEFGANFASDAIPLAQLSTLVLRVGRQQLSFDEKHRAAEQFSGRGISFNLDVQLLGAAYQSASWGGIGFGIRDRISGEFRLNSMLARIAFLGRLDWYFDSVGTNWRGDTVGYARHPQYYSQLFDSSRIAATWLRDYSLAYGKQIVVTRQFRMYTGVTVRLIEGYLLLDGTVERGSLTAYSAISPMFGVNYGKATTPSLRAGTGLVPVGSGFGVDVGTNIEISDTWCAALSILDIGSVMWDGNVFAAQDTLLNGLITTGFSSFDLFAEAQNITGEGGYFKWAGLRNVRTQLPMRLRVAVAHSIGTERDIGIEATVPLYPMAPGAPPLFVTIGGRYWFNPAFVISGGVRLGTITGWAMPVAIQISLMDGRWEMGISTQDLASLIFPKHPVLSAALALFRFHF